MKGKDLYRVDFVSMHNEKSQDCIGNFNIHVSFNPSVWSFYCFLNCCLDNPVIYETSQVLFVFHVEVVKTIP